MKKLINWLIHLLGGYTEEEMTELADRALKLTNKASKLIAEHSGDADRENYLALLNAHNASAEAAQKQNVTEMAKAIKAHCAKTEHCNFCVLCGEYSCKLAEIPCYWEVE